jgi:AraC family transcriptional regulator of adaptative response / DNA-3-methyladenine glycosylase II
MDLETCQIARMNKDRHFDGQFYFGVKTTGLFCRPSCPSPVAKEENVVYFNSMYEALDQGFRPCLRCQPDIQVNYYHNNIEGALIVKQSLEMIYRGYLSDHSIPEMAYELHVSDRHLRNLFINYLGIPPVKIARYHKALFAKRLLLQSDLSVTSIVEASGFRSIRQFNDVFKDVFGMTPTQVRKGMKPKSDGEDFLELIINYQRPFNFDQMLEFLRIRAIKGVEVIEKNRYSRSFRYQGTKGYFTVSDNSEKNCLNLKIECDDIRGYMPIYHQVRRMFDVDADLEVISEQLSKDKRLLRGFTSGVVPRLPIAFEPFEFVIRAILGQQITVKAATTLARRIAERARLNTPESYPNGLEFFFPNANEMSKMNLDSLGITLTRQRTINTVVEAINRQLISLDVNQSFEQFHKEMILLKGIGDWTINYVAMRGLGMVDSFPTSDLGVIKALTIEGVKPTVKEITQIADKWRPYRAYAALSLWSGLSKKEGE